MNQINVMLVPTAQDYLILPAELIAHVFPYAPPLLIDSGSEYIIGGLLIQNDKIPLVDYFSNTTAPCSSTPSTRKGATANMLSLRTANR